jgi:Zinc-binding loop region of homing endonuclease
MKYDTIFARLVANTAEPESTQGCWVWTAAIDDRPGRGYPRINMRIDGKHRSLRAHRVMAQVFHPTPLTPEDEVDHLCYNTRCINPDHLDVVTKLVNLSRRRVGPVVL